MKWTLEDDGVWCLTDDEENHRAGLDTHRLYTPKWHWTAFPADYKGATDTRTVHGVSDDLEQAKADAESTVAQMDLQAQHQFRRV